MGDELRDALRNLRRAPANCDRLRLPGIALLALVAGLPLWICQALPTIAVSPLVLALATGAMVKNFLGIPACAAAGIKGATRRALRAGVVAMGLQLPLSELMSMGPQGALIVGGALIATFAVTLWLGSKLGVDPRLAQLIAAGTSICGASAVVATNTVARAEEEDVAYAVAAVSIFGTVSVLLYPMLGHMLQMTADSYGLWVGASIHEIGQVAAAADAWKSSSDIAMIAKLSRVMLLAPVVLLLGAFAKRARMATQDTRRVEPPWFLLGFLVMMLVGSADCISAEHKQWSAGAATLLLTLALAGLGLELDLRKLHTRGWRPLALGALSSVFICVSTLAGILMWK